MRLFSAVACISMPSCFCYECGFPKCHQPSLARLPTLKKVRRQKWWSSLRISWADISLHSSCNSNNHRVPKNVLPLLKEGEEVILVHMFDLTSKNAPVCTLPQSTMKKWAARFKPIVSYRVYDVKPNGLVCQAERRYCSMKVPPYHIICHVCILHYNPPEFCALKTWACTNRHPYSQTMCAVCNFRQKASLNWH